MIGRGLILGIESSCDETAAAIVERGARTLSSVVASQIATHARYGGVVPELASREHLRAIVPVVRAALAHAGVTLDDLDAIAVTSGPGLAGALLVGITYAKALAFAQKLPLIAINHLEGHIHAVLLNQSEQRESTQSCHPERAQRVEGPASAGAASSPPLGAPGLASETWDSTEPIPPPVKTEEAGAPPFPRPHAERVGDHDSGAIPDPEPALALVVSGGHTHLYLARDWTHLELLQKTRDDAAGEAFDKTARMLNLGYPGGPIVDTCARRAERTGAPFTPPKFRDGKAGWSFSGLKTAAVRQLELFKRPGAESSPANIAASFQKAAIDLLLSRLFRVVEDTGLTRVVAGGGVAANSYLRRVLAARRDLEVRFPSLRLCGDNGAMVAGIACKYIERGESSGLDAGVSARVSLFRRPQN